MIKLIAGIEYGAFYQTYVDKVPDKGLIAALRSSNKQIELTLAGISEQQSVFFYAPGKWTIKQMVQHLIDTERVFAYRAFCIARGEQQPLPGFDENKYAASAPASHRTFASLQQELKLVRRTTIQLFQSLPAEQLRCIGSANNHPFSTLALGVIIAGHTRHHNEVLQTRYLKG